MRIDDDVSICLNIYIHIYIYGCFFVCMYVSILHTTFMHMNCDHSH